eukprot:scaffold93523_cov43-Phaeocystis_antarctica.AAC.3
MGLVKSLLYVQKIISRCHYKRFPPPPAIVAETVSPPSPPLPPRRPADALARLQDGAHGPDVAAPGRRCRVHRAPGCAVQHRRPLQPTGGGAESRHRHAARDDRGRREGDRLLVLSGAAHRDRGAGRRQHRLPLDHAAAPPAGIPQAAGPARHT